MTGLVKQLGKWLSKDRQHSKIAAMMLLEANMHQNMQ